MKLVLDMKSTMTKILLAKPIVDKRIEELKREVQELSLKPKIAIILVGENPASQIYVRNKLIQAKNIGAEAELIKLNANVSEENFLKAVEKINTDKTITGGLIQLPLPKQLQKLDVSSLINVEKDVDGFHPKNIANLYLGNLNIVPCTPKGIGTLLKFYDIDPAGKNVTIIGRSNIVGKPLASLLNHMNATITLCHSYTKDLKEHARHADILVSAVGKPEFINSEYINPEKKQVFIDVGISKTFDGIKGDMNFDDLKDKIAAITPVPGGVGPLTILSLLENLIITTKNQQ